ncbi:hypothetical protein LTR70_010113 [Exophiala xenobiotica]|uniref:Uncharacterized protein n=1 Tax=Lithohypha guttulata TaxID=1690604 RepID=A0ABR0JV50_9EURO|nr:hypothetical protein LTR24_010059 [Lithohypha guttulata]KAK5309646.1 hypothetical protein LTR70_010113 [Exophiala xenobiotica]
MTGDAWLPACGPLQAKEVADSGDLLAPDDEEEDFVKKLVAGTGGDSVEERHDSGIGCALMEFSEESRASRTTDFQQCGK